MTRAHTRLIRSRLPGPPPLAVRLPDLPSLPVPWRGATYVLRTLLTSGSDNPKLRRSDASPLGYRTWGLALAPAREAGFQACPGSSPGCRAHCLYRQGMARLDTSIAAARVARSVAFREHREWFRDRLFFELEAAVRRSEAAGLRVAVRLNLTSDIAWERVLPEAFDRFPDVRYYDYSKRQARMMRFLRGGFPSNYSLTFSRSEGNKAACREVLGIGGTVAVVFRRRPFPAQYLGAHVLDGDGHDLRFLDPPGVVVGLSAKGSAKSDGTGFVVDAEGERYPLPGA